MLLFVWKSLNGLAPQYISELIKVHDPPRPLRSTGQLKLDAPTGNKKTRGDRAFSIVGPTLWNLLPPQIRLAPSIGIFKSRLKTHLFALAFISI